MAHHIPASPGPRVAGNETIARVRSVRVLLGTDAASRPVVDDVNFDLRRGERLGVAGGAASGTSALARAISGHAASGETVTAGTVDIDGAVHRLTDGVGTRVPLVAITSQGDPAAAVRGERNAILRALRGAAGLVVVDQTSDLPRDCVQEPNAAFLARAFAAHDAALVLVTDDLGVLRQTCDTVQVLLAGRIVERGPAAEVLSHPHHRYTDMLVSEDAEAASPAPGARRPSGRWTPPATRPPGGCAFEPSCPAGHGRRDCSTTFPESRSFASPFGSVTAKCHRPGDIRIASAHSRGNEEES